MWGKEGLARAIPNQVLDGVFTVPLDRGFLAHIPFQMAVSIWILQPATRHRGLWKRF